MYNSKTANGTIQFLCYVSFCDFCQSTLLPFAFINSNEFRIKEFAKKFVNRCDNLIPGRKHCSKSL